MNFSPIYLALLIHLLGIVISSEKSSGYLTNKDLKAGWYYISDLETGYNIQLEKTSGYFFVNPVPIVTAKDFQYISLAYRKLDGKEIPVLAILLNRSGAKRFEMATKRSIGRRIGFVLNKKLLTAPIVQGVIESGTTIVSGEYDIDELEQFKKEIEKEIKN